MQVMDKDISKDIFETLYNIEPNSTQRPEDYPDVFFGRQRFDIELGFLQEDAPDDMYVMTLNLPLGKIECTPEKWAALLARFAAHINQNLEPGASYRPATAEEMIDFRERQRRAVKAESLAKYLAALPKEGLYQA